MQRILLFSFSILMFCTSCETLILTISSEKKAEFRVDGETAYVNGVLGKKGHKAFLKMIENHPDVNTLVLQEMPGSLNDEWNVKTCKKIRELGMTTYLENGNASDNTFLIVLHSGPGIAGLDYRRGVFMFELEKKYAVVYTDQRGQGMSQGHLNTERIAVSELIKDVEALILVIKEKYGADSSIFLLGHSWGGTLGTACMTCLLYTSPSPRDS